MRMEMDDRYAHLRIPDHVVYREMDGALVLTSLKAGGFLRLDDVGRRIWQAIERGAGAEDVVADLTGAFDVSPATPGYAASTYKAFAASAGTSFGLGYTATNSPTL